MDAKTADIKFKELYGRDTEGVDFDYSTIIPTTLIEKFDELNGILSLNFSPKPKTLDDAISDIDALISSYETIKSNCPYKNISRDMTSLIIGCSQIYDEEMCNFYTSDVTRNSKKPVSSRLTKVVFNALSFENDDVFDRLTSLINTVIEYFDPIIVGKVLSSIIIRNRDKKYFTEERIRGYYEALINRENVLYAGKYISIEECVGCAYFDTTYTTAEDVLTDKHGVYSVISMGNNPVYGDTFKQIVTSRVLDDILHETTGTSDDPCIVVLRHIREDVVDWIKHKNLDERPECPESFKYIDINQFMSSIYVAGIHILGNSSEIISKFDKEYDLLDDKLDDKNLSKEEHDKIESRMKTLKARKTEYLTLKSNIAFLFMEILSNEKIAYKVFNEALVSNIALMEPSFGFGMEDVCNNVNSLFIKRDFNPINAKSINPYYIHFGEQELSSDESKYIASVISSSAHPGIKSVTALAGVYNFETFENMIASLKYHYVSSLDIYSNVVESCKKRIFGICEQYSSSIPEEIKTIVNSVDGLNMDKVFEIKKLLNENVNNADYENALSYLSSSVSEIDNMFKWIRSQQNSVENIITQIKDVLNNITDKTVISGAKRLCVNDKPIKNFWPITQSYEFEIAKNDQLSNYDENIVPGDIVNERYGRYKVANPD